MPGFDVVSTSKGTDSQEMPSQIWDAALHARQNDIDNEWLTAAKVAVAGVAGFALADLVPGIGRVALAGAGTAFAFDIAPNLKHLSRDNLAQFCFDSALSTIAAKGGYAGFKVYAHARALSACKEVDALYNRDAMSGRMFNMIREDDSTMRNTLSLFPRAKQIYWTEKALGTKVHPSLVPLYANLAGASEHISQDFSRAMASRVEAIKTALKL